MGSGREPPGDFGGLLDNTHWRRVLLELGIRVEPRSVLAWLSAFLTLLRDVLADEFLTLTKPITYSARQPIKIEKNVDTLGSFAIGCSSFAATCLARHGRFSPFILRSAETKQYPLRGGWSHGVGMRRLAQEGGRRAGSVMKFTSTLTAVSLELKTIEDTRTW
jgi:hypothetical protein